MRRVGHGRIILKLVLRRRDERGLDWIDLAQDKDRWGIS
jgi:hypothetical protein